MKKEEIEKLVELQLKKENTGRVFDKVQRSRKAEIRLLDSNGYEQGRFNSEDFPLLSEEMIELFYSIIGNYLTVLEHKLSSLILAKQGDLQFSLNSFNILEEKKEQKDEE